MIFGVMHTYNEEDRYLERVVRRLLPILGEHLYVFDDRSTDRTTQIAADLGARVSIRPNGVASFLEHEGEFRQWGWQTFLGSARPRSGDWCLAIDADEIFCGGEHLASLLGSTYDILGITHYQMWNETHYRADKAWAPHRSTRLFRILPGWAGQGVLQRQLACGSEPEYVRELVRQRRVLWDTPFRIQHMGYARDEDKKSKYERYMMIDGGAFHSLAHLQSILDPQPVLLPWEK